MSDAIRLAPPPNGEHIAPDLDDSRICYWQSPRGWWIYLPGAGIGRLVNHDVTEHEDGTITVKPSIGLRVKNEGGARPTRLP